MTVTIIIVTVQQNKSKIHKISLNKRAHYCLKGALP